MLEFTYNLWMVAASFVVALFAGFSGLSLLRGASAPVIPVFVNGLHEDFGVQLKRRVRLAPRETIRLFFGPPVELGDLYDRARDSDAHLAASQRVMDAIGACAEREKAWLAAQPG